MRTHSFTFFRRIYIWVFAGITYLATTDFYEASTQLLNKDVAAHIGKFTSPYGSEGFDRKKADSVFQDAMVISPSAEVYFLDTVGRVISFHCLPSEIQHWQVPLEPLQRWISTHGLQHINGPDPRDPFHAKIFSAAAVDGPQGPLGYIYVVLGSSQYRSVTQMLFKSHITPLVLGAFLFIIAISLILTLIYIRRIRIRFDDMMVVLDKFRGGDITARFSAGGNDDLTPVMDSFNKMADLLLENIRRLTVSEKERKDFMVNISHDLRTPLAIARGYAETLLLSDRPILPEQEKKYGELVIGKIRQVENMVRKLFELSKMESASFVASKEPFIFSEIVQEVIHAIAPDPGKNGLALDCIDCTDGSWVEADISMMERVIQNLVVNAVAYTMEGGRITVSLISGEQELVFRIENEGAPLAPDLLQWLNQAGTAPQEEDAHPADTTPRPSRPAIGLAIVRKVLLLHHFPFHVESTARPHAATGLNIFSFRMPVRQHPASR